MLDTDGVHELQHLVDVVLDLERVIGLGAVAVADEVDRPHREELRVGLQVPDIGLGVPGDAVQQDQRRLAGVTGVQVPGAVPAGVDEALGELGLGQVGPDTGVGAGFRHENESFWSSVMNGDQGWPQTSAGSWAGLGAEAC